MRRIMFIALLLLTGCATAPTQTNNVCAVFDQRDGFFNNWYKQAKSVETEYGVPVPILMATIYTESGYQARVKPPRTKLFGFIPWSRPSTAYGIPRPWMGHGRTINARQDAGPPGERISAMRFDSLAGTMQEAIR